MAEQGRLTGLLTRACGKADPRTREAAFDELIRLLMIYIRAGMGTRLRDQRESMDVCQSVAKSFVEDFETGRLVFDSEAALAAYLQRAVRSKLADLARSDTALKRGGGDHAPALDAEGAPQPSSDTPGPGSIVLDNEQRDRAIAALTDEERALVRLRMQGMEWDDIARHLNKDAATIRQQFSRAQRRITTFLDT